MLSLKPKLLGITAGITIGIAGLGFTSNAYADAMYDASSYFSLTLSSVTDASGEEVESGWWMGYYPAYYPDPAVFVDEFATNLSGDGAGNYHSDVGSEPMGVGDVLTLKTGANGYAGNGNAESESNIYLDFLTVENYSDTSLNFIFNFEYELTASVDTNTGPSDSNAVSEAYLDVLDYFGGIDMDYTASASMINGIADQPAYLAGSGTFDFMLYSDEYNDISIWTGSNGIANSSAPVPEPATMLLFGTGLAGIGAGRLRQKKIKNRSTEGFTDVTS